MHRSSIASRMRRDHRAPFVFVAACALITFVGACNLNDGTSPGADQSLSKSSGDSQTVLAGRPLSPIVVKVTSNGTPQSGVTVTWSTSTGVGTLNPASSTTDANGLAQTVFTKQKAGVDTVRATTTGGLVAFLVTIVADSTTGALFAAGGNGAAALVGIGIQLTVKSADVYGNARGGIVVNFAAGTGLLSKTTATTDATSGQASTIFTPGPAKGTYTVQATANGFAPITFTVTAI